MSSTDDLVCSARGCGSTATWGLEWRNPKIHAPERRKVWLACDDHRVSLRDFLAARAFPVEVLAAEDARAR